VEENVPPNIAVKGRANSLLWAVLCTVGGICFVDFELKATKSVLPRPGRSVELRF
jgi:hypothetical protein